MCVYVLVVCVVPVVAAVLWWWLAHDSKALVWSLVPGHLVTMLCYTDVVCASPTESENWKGMNFEL
jgi:MFS superfamily sulfate permease-like transporter